MVHYSDDEINKLDAFYEKPDNLVDLFENSARKWAQRPAIGYKDPDNNTYRWVTYREIQERVDNLRGGIHELGFEKGQSIGVILNNSVEWFIIENATHGLGGRFVPMYEKELEKTWHYIINDSAITYLFVSTQAVYDKVIRYRNTFPALKEVIIVYGSGNLSMSSLEKTGMSKPVASYKPHWSDIAELIYTSGTPGDPKGVLLSHGNLTACSQSGYIIFPELNKTSISLSILPWAHSYGLSAELHNFLQFGGSIGIMESVDTIGRDLQLVRPTHLIAVPRVFNKIYDGIQLQMNIQGGLKKKLFDATCAEAVKCRNSKRTVKLMILDKLVFSKIRQRFGGRIQGVMTASAVMNPDIAMFFRDIGIPTYDCYGLTETSPAITMNSPLMGNKYGTVGKCVRNMHVTIDRSRSGSDSEDGEIIAYGAHVMMGYHNKPGETDAVMVQDRWKGFPGMRTGDLGRLDDEGYLHITGRYEDEYKLSNGKYVHPESIETDIKLISYVANAFVYGDGKDYNVCIIVPDFEVISKDSRITQWADLAPRDIINDKNFQQFMSDEITAHLRRSFGQYEIPKKFLFTVDDFTHDNGMQTQTMKTVRRAVMENYGDDLMKLYDE